MSANALLSAAAVADAPEAAIDAVLRIAADAPAELSAALDADEVALVNVLMGHIAWGKPRSAAVAAALIGTGSEAAARFVAERIQRFGALPDVLPAILAAMDATGRTELARAALQRFILARFEAMLEAMKESTGRGGATPEGQGRALARQLAGVPEAFRDPVRWDLRATSNRTFGTDYEQAATDVRWMSEIALEQLAQSWGS